ncbi:MAG: hypothetical protein EBR54_02335 [Flavobacteriia bacterium]|nr:hypothetical protein [Flavobacteriia bacterium]
MSPTSSQLLHPAMYLHCFISIFIRVICPTSSSVIALFQFLLGLFARRAPPPRRTPPRNVSSLLYFNFYSGYLPDELLRRGGRHPAMVLHYYFNFSKYQEQIVLNKWTTNIKDYFLLAKSIQQ